MNNQSYSWEIVGKLKNKKAKINSDELIDLLLNNRGIKTLREKKEFFKPKHPEELSLKELGINKLQIKKAILRIKKARKTKEKVIVYGDYDADGICGTAILWETLYGLGINALPHIPERFNEGYGLNSDSIKKLKSEDKSLGLIITVDHGIVADKKIDYAKSLGIDVIISDHHTPGRLKPNPFALIHTTKISGSAVAWVLAREIAKEFKSQINGSLELVAIGTIADSLPLLGPNRSFVKFGLGELNKTKRPGLLALFEEAAIKPETIGPYEVGFIIAPRINATGRLTHALESLRLLCTKKESQARQLANYLGKTNSERQRIVEEVVVHARASLKGTKTEGVIVLAHTSYHEGVIGLAAARLVEEFYRPVIVISKKGKIAKASARSIAGFNIIETIRKLEKLYLEGGGHPMAAGFSLKTTMIEKFIKKLNAISIPLLSPEILTKKLKIDTELRFNQLNWQLVDFLKAFQPVGLGNPTPTFVSRGLKLIESRIVGREGKHLKLKLSQNEKEFWAIAFNLGWVKDSFNSETPVDCVYNVEENLFNGNRSIELKIKDIRLSPQ